MATIEIPHEPVTFSGDMNTHSLAEIDNLQTILHSKLPVFIGKQKFSIDPKTNSLVGKDGSYKTCSDQYKSENICTCCRPSLLDHIVYSTETRFLQPISSTIQVIPLQSLQPLIYKWSWCNGIECIFNKKYETRTGSMLSDHYPVLARFIF